MKNIYKKKNGEIVHGDNLEVLNTIGKNSIDSCISDFPYAIEFMGKNWDSSKHWNIGEGKHGTFEGTGYTGKKRPAFYMNTNDDKLKFYGWCYERAIGLFRVIKPGGYVAIFGHPKTNHRMKCAFEDAGFKIVEEIDWIYLSGMPKNQDIGKLFDKAAGVKRKVIGTKGLHSFSTSRTDKNHGILGLDERTFDEANQLTAPSTDLAKKWDGWKTAGLKPAHEPITVFQKPLDGTYIKNIEKYGCGAMNINACRIPISKSDIDRLNAKASKNPTTNYSDRSDKVYGKFAEDKASPANEQGRFPANIILDEFTAQILDEQTGITQSKQSMRGVGLTKSPCYRSGDLNYDTLRGHNDKGGGSRMFTIIKYFQKVSPKERMLPNGERNPHVTLKPVELIKWLIKLLTPVDGMTIDITSGSCTHAVACEELNKNDGYNLKWLNVEIMNTESEPYCDVGKIRAETI